MSIKPSTRCLYFICYQGRQKARLVNPERKN
uniref:Pollen-specific protein SF21-like n=1 Tax=Rhizophora mucronata TaxID=61149 RepID=A0A2P2IYY8_RHIMU